MKRIKRVTIVGVGLIGGSIGLALRRRRKAIEVVGIGRRAESLRKAKQVGAVVRTTTDLAKGVAGSQLIVVCTPVDAIVETVRQIAPHATPGSLITDAGSTKAEIVSALDQDLGPGARFIGSHPLAGLRETCSMADRLSLPRRVGHKPKMCSSCAIFGRSWAPKP